MVLGILRRYRSLSHDDRRLLLRAFVALAAVSVELRVRGIQRLAGDTSARPQPRQYAVDPEQFRRARQYFRWIESASRRHVLRTRCLHRAIVLHRWLLRDRMPSQLRIGVRKEDRNLTAHAWVEIGGQVVGDPDAHVASFTPLAGPRGRGSPRDAAVVC